MATDDFSFGAGQDSPQPPFSAPRFDITTGVSGSGFGFGAGIGRDIFGTSSGNSQQRWQSHVDNGGQQQGPGYQGINALPSGAYDQRSSVPNTVFPSQRMRDMSVAQRFALLIGQSGIRDLTPTQKFRLGSGLIDASAPGSSRNAVTPNTVGEVKANRDNSTPANAAWGPLAPKAGLNRPPINGPTNVFASPI